VSPGGSKKKKGGGIKIEKALEVARPTILVVIKTIRLATLSFSVPS
jgi:hypothetical protein